ncbi:hypothetical protein Anapl_01762 [Anas platyrhynchos]|uniref:Uncharacterized protein n=1 Tax=Anas platyrhynchos TaxID=8839 RepID=R0LPL4_ANAPL|nr:hypothetical protein Anapl_01762 [Anas platyrhynchos]
MSRAGAVPPNILAPCPGCSHIPALPLQLLRSWRRSPRSQEQAVQPSICSPQVLRRVPPAQMGQAHLKPAPQALEVISSAMDVAPPHLGITKG